MQKDPTNTYMEIIGHYLIDRAMAEPETAAAINEPKKTLKGAMDEVMKMAQKNKKGNVAVLTPPQVFGVIDQYFRLEANVWAMYKAIGMTSQEDSQPVDHEMKDTTRPVVLQGGKAKKNRVDIDLDDFL